jgi:hypothetical protein
MPSPAPSNDVIPGTNARGIELTWRIVKASHGDHAAIMPRTAWINVGTTPSGQGIINFRQAAPSHTQPKGSADCLIQYRFSVVHHLLEGAQSGQPLELTMVLGASPKPDDWAAFFLLDRALREGALPRGADHLAKYMADCRRSTLGIVPTPRTPHGETSDYFGEVGSMLERGECPPTVTLALACELLRDQCNASSDTSNFRAFCSLFSSALDTPCIATDESGAIDGRERVRPRGAHPRDFEMVDAQGWWLGSVDRGLDAIRDFWRFAEVVKHQSTVTPLSIEPPIRGASGGFTINVFRRDDAPTSADEVWREKLCLTSGLIAPKGHPACATLTIHPGKGRRDTSWNIHFEANVARAESESIIERMPALARMLEFEEQSQRGSVDRRRGPARYPDFPGIEDPWYDGRDHGYAFLASPAKFGSIIPPERLLEILASTPWLTAAHDHRPGFRTEAFTIRREHSHGSPGVPCTQSAFAGCVLQEGADGTMFAYGQRPGSHAWTVSRAAQGAFPAGADDSEFLVCVVWRRQQPDEPCERDVISLADHLLGGGVQRFTLTDRCECWLTPRGVVLLDVGDVPRDTGLWTSAVCDALAYRHRLDDIKASEGTGAMSQLVMFYETLRNWNPWRIDDPAARALVETLDGALGGKAMRENLAEYLRFSDERQRIVEEESRHKWNKSLTVLLAVISVVSLLQIPFELIQAYGAGEQAWLDASWPSRPPGWIWWLLLAAVGIVASIVLATPMFRKRSRSRPE